MLSAIVRVFFWAKPVPRVPDGVDDFISKFGVESEVSLCRYKYVCGICVPNVCISILHEDPMFSDD